jgi:hypothetical protein
MIVTYVVALDPRGKIPLDLANLTSLKQALCIAYARNLILKKPQIVERYLHANPYTIVVRYSKLYVHI